MILLMDPRIGNFRAVMDGALITNWRTGAQTAVALKYLHKDKSIRMGLYGAGMQGHTQTMAICEFFDIEEIRVYDINRQAAKTFAENMQKYVKGEIKIADTPKDAARGDAIVCVTQSREKFVKNDWVRPGTILFPMGSYQECENEFIINADKIIVDHVEQCLHRGALKELAETEAIGENDIYATIGEIAAGKKQVEISKNERVLCIPIGTGAMDVAIATIVLERATEKNIGESFAFV